MSSSSKELSKFEKEKQKLVQEKCQGLLNEMLRDDDNKYCVDCDAKGPRWASWNLGIFLCIRCAGIHRNLGVHISRVKSVNLDSWTPEQVVTMQQMGNSRARAVYEANLPDNFRRPQTDVALENFIRAKYEHKKYIAQEWVKPAPPRVDWNAEIEEQIRKKKEKRTNETTVGVLPKLGSKINSQVKASSTPTAPPKPLGKVEIPVAAAPAPSPGPTSTTASDDLLGLNITGGGDPFVDPFASPVKSTNEGAAAAAGGSTGPSDNDLGSVFTAAPGGDSNGKMSKESILSLYGSMSGGAPAAGGFAGGGAPGITSNPFMGTQNPGFGGPGVAANPFPAWGANESSFNQPQSNVAQLQQGVFSLNLGGGGVGAPVQNSNAGMFNSNASTNLNMLSGLSTTTNPSPFLQMGNNPQFGGVPGLQQPQASGVAQFNVMQSQGSQQGSVFNQFQSASTATQGSPVSYGMFQNGGTPSNPSVDLLWK